MIPNPVMVLLNLGIAADMTLSHIQAWGPPLLTVALATVARTTADRVRAHVRTLAALCSMDSTITALTCTDTCPDTVADTCPDRSGHVTDGGC